MPAALDLILRAGRLFRASDIPDLAWWVEADRISGLADAAAVVTWTENLGTGLDPTQGTAGSRPTYRTNSFNSKPGARFDGTDDNLATAGTFTPSAAPLTLAIVVKPRVTVGVNLRLMGMNGATVIRFQPTASNVGFVVGGTTATQATPLAQLAGEILVGVYDGATATLWHNGIAGSGASVVATPTAAAIFIGGLSGVNSFDGDVLAGCVYNRALTAAEVATFTRGMAAKYKFVVA